MYCSMVIFVIVYLIKLIMLLSDVHQQYSLKFAVSLNEKRNIQKTFSFSLLDIQSTVVIHYDTLTSRIYIRLDPSFVNRVRGLCGTFNYITKDDFLTPNNVIETNLVTFANAYLASSCSISDQKPDACFNFPAVRIFVVFLFLENFSHLE